MRTPPTQVHAPFALCALRFALCTAAALTSCRAEPASPSTQQLAAEAAPAVAPAADVRFVPEMEPLPGVSEAPVAVTPGMVAAFHAVWGEVRSDVAARVTPEELAGISRWARAETQSATLTPGWINTLKMEPIGREGGFAVFGQRAVTGGVELASHSPLVRRRLIVAPVFDPATRTIPTVFVTIRGWAEE